MGDDYLKRFNLSETRAQKPFALSTDQRPPVKTKDNTHPVIPPPKTVFLPHPTLAPPGMMGSRLAADAAKWMENKGRPFKPLVTSRDKDRGPER